MARLKPTTPARRARLIPKSPLRTAMWGTSARATARGYALGIRARELLDEANVAFRDLLEDCVEFDRNVPPVASNLLQEARLRTPPHRRASNCGNRDGSKRGLGLTAVAAEDLSYTLDRGHR